MRAGFRFRVLDIHEIVYGPALYGSLADHLAVMEERGAPVEARLKKAILSGDLREAEALVGPGLVGRSTNWDEFAVAINCAALHVNNKGFQFYHVLGQVLLARMILTKEVTSV